MLARWAAHKPSRVTLLNVDDVDVGTSSDTSMAISRPLGDHVGDPSDQTSRSRSNSRMSPPVAVDDVEYIDGMRVSVEAVDLAYESDPIAFRRPDRRIDAQTADHGRK